MRRDGIESTESVSAVSSFGGGGRSSGGRGLKYTFKLDKFNKWHTAEDACGLCALRQGEGFLLFAVPYLIHPSILKIRSASLRAGLPESGMNQTSNRAA
jgi:hypothetical protein